MIPVMALKIIETNNDKFPTKNETNDDRIPTNDENK